MGGKTVVEKKWVYLKIKNNGAKGLHWVGHWGRNLGMGGKNNVDAFRREPEGTKPIASEEKGNNRFIFHP